VLRNGGTLYVDGGKPAPGLFCDLAGQSAQRDADGIFQRAALVFDMLIAALRGDDELRRRFFSEVKFAFYAGAALPQNLWDALEALSVQTVGRALPMVSAWGSTETSPLANRLSFPGQAFRQYRYVPISRHRIEAGALRRQARSAGTRTPMSRRATGRRRN